MCERVVVTGGSGFIGSHIIKELRLRGYSPANFDIWANPRHDVRNPWAVMDYFKGASAVMHLAAEPYIPYGYQNPELFIDTNITGTMIVLNAVRRLNIDRLLVWSSSEIYGTCQTHRDEVRGMDETHPLNPHSTYAVTKLAQDRLAFSAWKEHKLPVIIVRQFNCYGPNETQPYIVPTLIEQRSQYEHFNLGNVEAKRDFTYVEDAARAGVDLLENSEAVGEIFNVGTGKAYSVRDIASKISQIFDPKFIAPINIDAYKLRPHDVDLLICDPTKMRLLTGWKPKVNLDEGLKKTVEWYNNHGGWDYRNKGVD